MSAAARAFDMHYHRRATMVHTELPGLPAGGTARHVLSREHGTLTGRGLVWFELSGGAEQRNNDVHTVVTLDCPLSDSLSSAAGQVHLAAAYQLATEIDELSIHETPRGLLARAPGALDLDRCAAMTAALRHLATNL